MKSKGNHFVSLVNLYGDEKVAKNHKSHVCIIGLGGVGSWVAEALVRQGVGELTLIEMDHIVESNINRQIQALETNIGISKVNAIGDRIKSINSECKLNLVDDFLTVNNMNKLIGKQFDVVVDAIDQVSIKRALIEYCLLNQIKLLVSGGAGGKKSPEKIRSDDLLKSKGDPLLSKLRKYFRKNNPKKNKLGITTIFSDEQIIKNDSCLNKENNLSCSGYGSTLLVTAVMGFYLASEVQKIIHKG
jgi:tRNA A37 threonylcarbamoyladenosine dehydratase